MIEDINFPTRIVLPQEADNERHRLRRTVQRVQAAYLELKNDPDFVLPESFEQLTPDYSRAFFRPYLDAISKDFTLDEAQRQKLKNRWGRIQAAVTLKVNIVCDGINSTPQLKWHFDETIQMPVPTASIDQVAEEWATRDVPQNAAGHWLVLQALKSAFQTLRKWEDENGVSRWPLRNLFSLDQTRFAEEWAAHRFDVPEPKDENQRIRWEIFRKSIF